MHKPTTEKWLPNWITSISRTPVSGFPNPTPFSRLAIGLLLLVFGVLSALGMSHHELWLDEAHHWLLARDSASLPELIYHARYDGHPLLWNLLLFAITRFSDNPVWMQVLHGSIALTTTWLVLTRAPFSKLWKVLFVFGYFPFYEYNLLSRSYALGVLLLFTVCILYPNRSKHYPALGAVLALLANVHVLFLVLAVVWGITLVIDLPKHSPALLLKCRIGFTILVAGILLSALQIILLSYHFHRLSLDPWLNLQWLGKDLLMMEQAMVPVPLMTDGHFWNSNLLLWLTKPVAALLSVGLWLMPVVLFSRKQRWLWFFYAGALGLVGVLHLAQHSGVRYFGLLYMWLVVARWLSTSQETAQAKKDSAQQSWLTSFQSAFNQPFWYTLAILQLVAGLIAYSLDMIQPFSEAKNAVNYLQERQLDNRLIAVSFLNAGPPVSTYLGKKVFYPEINAMGSFCIWNTTPFFISQDTLLNKIGQQAQRQEIILLLNHSLESQGQPVLTQAVYPAAKVSVRLLAKFDQSIMRNENQYIYQVEIVR